MIKHFDSNKVHSNIAPDNRGGGVVVYTHNFFKNETKKTKTYVVSVH